MAPSRTGPAKLPAVRHGRPATVVILNGSFLDRGGVFGNVGMPAAFVDRIPHRSDIAVRSRRRPAAATLAALAAAVMQAACSDGSRPFAEGAEGPHVDGRRHGVWRIGYSDGSVEEGRYADGRLHGEWTLRNAEGAVVARELWCHGRCGISPM